MLKQAFLTLGLLICAQGRALATPFWCSAAVDPDSGLVASTCGDLDECTTVRRDWFAAEADSTPCRPVASVWVVYYHDRAQAAYTSAATTTRAYCQHLRRLALARHYDHVSACVPETDPIALDAKVKFDR